MQWISIIFRWGHFLAGITWIGLLYYFNAIQGPYLKAVSAEAKGEAFKHLVPNALWWFRWAALATWVFGALLLGHARFVDAFALQGTEAIIGMGSWLGTIMLINVWAIIWRNQKIVLGMVPAKPEEKTAAARKAFLASRVNVMLSIPMLFFMAASTHGGGLFFSM
jgi:uncharacterized membrane protein